MSFIWMEMAMMDERNKLVASLRFALAGCIIEDFPRNQIQFSSRHLFVVTRAHKH